MKCRECQMGPGGYVCPDCTAKYQKTKFKFFCGTCLTSHDFHFDGFSKNGTFYTCRPTGRRLEVFD